MVNKENTRLLQSRASWRLLGGLIVSLSFVIMFAAIAEEVANHELPVAVDQLVEGMLLSEVSPQVAGAFKIITLLGSGWIIAGLAAMLLIWLAWRQELRRATLLLISVGGGGLLSDGLKLIFQRPRPDFPDVFVKATGYSFPSGHAMLSLIFFGFLAYLLLKSIHNWKQKTAAGLGLILIPFAVGISRLILGVHFPTDVLGGWAAGAGWLAVCLTINEIFPLTFKKSHFGEGINLG